MHPLSGRSLGWSAWDTQTMVSEIEAIREPYRGHLLRWLERFTVQPLHELDGDLHRFLLQLNPVEREEFAGEARRLLEEAVRYFGFGRGGWTPPMPPHGVGAS
jgi:hypothetical protein